MIAAEQPVRYGSRRKAGSLALVMMLRGPTATDSTQGRWHLACFGNGGHYQPVTGQCVHVESLVAGMGEWHRARARYLPFGDNASTARRLEAKFKEATE